MTHNLAHHRYLPCDKALQEKNQMAVQDGDLDGVWVYLSFEYSSIDI
jgi:hypothetical protein